MRKKQTALIKYRPSADVTPFNVTGRDTRPMEPGEALDDLVAAIKASLARRRETDSPIFLMMPELPEADINSVAAVSLTFIEDMEHAEACADRGESCARCD